MRRWILRITGVFACLIGLVTIVGYLLPMAHVASRVETFPAAPDRVFAVLTEVGEFAQWRPDVRSVEILAREPLRWRERGANDDITFEVQESRPPSRLVVRIADPALPFGGSWTYDLAPEGSRTRLTITENGEVYNPLFRFMSRFVFGHTATIDRFLAALRARLAR